MQGNPHAPADTSTSLNSASAETSLRLWLALPAARAHFDPAKLSAEEQARFSLRGPRGRADFEVSRALLAFVNSGSGADSLSHSAEHAALLRAPSGWRVGVDLELNRPRDVLRLARFAFSERELSSLEAAAEDARPQLFYTLWTLKEAFAKSLGLELVDALRQCVFWNEDGKWQGRVPATTAWSAAVFRPRPDIFLAAAWSGGHGREQLEQWEWPPGQRVEWPRAVDVRSAGCPNVPPQSCGTGTPASKN